MLCTPAVDTKQTCGSNKLSGCGCAVILECECQMRWREKGDDYTAHPTWQPCLPASAWTDRRRQQSHARSNSICCFSFHFSFLFLTHPFILDWCEESHMTPSFNLSSKEFLAHLWFPDICPQIRATDRLWFSANFSQRNKSI